VAASSLPPHADNEAMVVLSSAAIINALWLVMLVCCSSDQT
jgi:hypothetical protein